MCSQQAAQWPGRFSSSGGRSAKPRAEAPGQRGANAGDEFLGVEGLGNEVVGAGGEAINAVLEFVAGGEEDEVDIATAGFGADLVAELEAAHFRHAPIGDDEADRVVAEDFEGGGAIGGAENVVAGVVEGGANDGDGHLVVINNKYTHKHLAKEKRGR